MAAIEGIDDQTRLRLARDQEVRREANAGERQTGSPADLDVHQGQRDRDAQTTIEHLVQVAVTRVVIGSGVTPKTLLAKQERVQDGQLAVRRGPSRETPSQRATEVIELVQVGSRVEARVFLAGNQQGRTRQVDLALAAADESRQRPPRFGCVRQRRTTQLALVLELVEPLLEPVELEPAVLGPVMLEPEPLEPVDPEPKVVFDDEPLLNPP
jgi:hypothetical protein